MRLYKINNTQKITVLLIIQLCLGTHLYAQDAINFIEDTFRKYTINTNTTDSLVNYSFDDLIKKYSTHKKDTVLALVYTKAFLAKAKKEKSKKHLLAGYLLNLKVTPNDDALLYADSLLYASKTLQNKKYESRAYFYKGTYLYKKRKFIPSLDNLLIADSISSIIKDHRLSAMINFNIGSLKTRLGDEQEALTIFKNSFEILKSKDFKKDDNYYKYLFSLSNSYRRNKQIDSAMKYCKLGILESKNYSKNLTFYNDFLLSKGILEYNLENTIEAEKNITLAQNYYENHTGNQAHLAFCYYYNAIINRDDNKHEQSITGMQKVDSLYLTHGDIHPELIGTYDVLISYYKSKNDTQNQLLYIERLLEVTNYLQENYRYLYKNIATNYEIPKLLKEKELLLDKQANKNKWVYSILILIILGISTLVIINYRKKKIYKDRLDKILQDPPPSTKKEKTLTTKTEINISEDIINSVTSGLEKFIDQEQFLEKDITVGNIAKKTGTNAKYLAAIIKEKYDKSFILFINDLRIEYAIKKLKIDPKFRLYTIQGIAQLSGFRHPDSFTRAFIKKTGLKPSYFLKNLK